MTAAEWGELGPADDGTAGDAVLAAGFARTFVTASPAGFPQVVTVAAIPALLDSGADPEDATARRDVLVVTTIDTYLMGADLMDGDPFDSEAEYTWPIDYWPASSRDPETDEPTLDALDASARAYVEQLPQAWIDAMPAPAPGTLLDGEPFPS